LNSKINTLAKGKKFKVCEIEKGKKSEVKEFFSKLNKADKDRILQKINYIADNGPPKNEEKFRYEGDGIYAIKQNQVRIYCFFDSGKMIILTHGFMKKDKKANPNQLEKAKNIKNYYFKYLKKG
jgi:mRNA-degrading endonuclease RelE of RelBE toxin-antitoxin system